MQKIMALAVISLITVLALPTNYAEAKKTNVVKLMDVDCNVPNASLQDAIDNADGPVEITFVGPCVGDLSVTVDDITLRGQTVNDTIDGSIFVNGARRLTLDAFTLAGLLNGATGVIAFDGASVRITDLIIDGDLGAGIFAEQGVGAFHGAVVRIFGTTVRNVETGVVAFGGSVAEVRSSSVVELFTNQGVQSDQGSSVRVLDSLITMQDGSDNGVLVGRHSMITIQDSTVTAGATTVNSTLGHPVLVNEGSFARIQNSTIIANNSDPNSGIAAVTVLLSSGRLRGDGNDISNIGGGMALAVLRGTLTQDAGHTDITGSVEIGENATAQFQDVTIVGDVVAFQDSFLKLRNRSGNPAQISVDGSVTITQDSTLNVTAFGGGGAVRITGDLDCTDGESSWSETIGGLTVISGTNNCTGF